MEGAHAGEASNFAPWRGYSVRNLSRAATQSFRYNANWALLWPPNPRTYFISPLQVRGVVDGARANWEQRLLCA